MKELSIEEVKKVQLDILNIVTSYCESQEISYFLGSGTLIGAVRHNGYIPWDDDIDLLMPRPDFEKFISTFNNNIKNYEVFSHITNKTYPYPFAKVSDKKTLLVEGGNTNLTRVGINIDIFPVDGLPNDSNKQEKLFKKMNFLKKVLSLWNVSNNNYESITNSVIIKMLIRIIKLFDYRLVIKIMTFLVKKNKYEFANDVGMIVWSSSKSVPRVQKKVFEDYKLEIFEGASYRIPIGYHEWLTKVYGDYMKLPPEDKRISHHDFKAYYLD